MNPFKERKERLSILKNMQKPTRQEPKNIDGKDNLFIRCQSCNESITRTSLSKNLYVCPQCGYHFKVPAYYRLSILLDTGSFTELNRRLISLNLLNFPGYGDKLKSLSETTGLNEGVVTAIGKIDGRKAVFSVLDSRFLMGSMGTAVGEKITQAVEYATKAKLPVVIFSASGGARMQEGIFSLMQMAKTSAAIEKHNRAGLLYISICTNPTTGGVTASFASLGDYILSEPGALIGFAGPRVIEETIHQKLPEGFQSAEYLMKHGFIDAIIPRVEMRETLSKLLRLHVKRGLI